MSVTCEHCCYSDDEGDKEAFFIKCKKYGPGCMTQRGATCAEPKKRKMVKRKKLVKRKKH